LNTLATPLVLLVFLLALGVIWRRRQDDETRSVIFLLMLAALSLLAAPILVLAHNFYLRYTLPLFITLLTAIAFGSMNLRRWFGPLVVATLCAGWLTISVAVATTPEYSLRDDLKGVAHALGRAQADRVIAIDATAGEVFPLKLYRPNAVVPTQHLAVVSQLDVVALPMRGRAMDNGATRPPAPRLQTLPAGLRLVDTIFGPNYIVERYVASRPVKLALDPQSGLFGSVWRFLLEKRGAGRSEL
jgi:hypothetical protein